MTFSHFLFGVYPFIAGTVFLVGTILRYDREQYTWKADSSQLLEKEQLQKGSRLFHAGIIMLFFGHFAGLLTPHRVFLALGISDMAHQIIAISAGTLFGTLCMIGGVILWRRRMYHPRIRAISRFMDIFILDWLLVTLGLGLVTIPVSVYHAFQGDAEIMVRLADWAQGVVTWSPRPELLDEVPFIYKLHLFFGLTVFLLFPFTRLVHILTIPVNYLWRPYQMVRTKFVHYLR